MNKISLIFFILSFAIVKSQKCSDFTQNITANGHFNFTASDENFKLYLKDSIKSIDPIETNSIKNLEVFKKNFPNNYDGKCLMMKSREFPDKISYLCDEKQKDNLDKEPPKTFGKFELISILDNFYIFRYSAFEVSGYLVFDSGDKYSYVFGDQPRFSPDKKIIYSFYSNMYSELHIEFVQLDYYRKLWYTLQGEFNFNSSHLLQYSNTGNYGLLLDFDREIKIRDKNYNIIGVEKCNTKLKID